jgi:hypothetical protein
MMSLLASIRVSCSPVISARDYAAAGVGVVDARGWTHRGLHVRAKLLESSELFAAGRPGDDGTRRAPGLTGINGAMLVEGDLLRRVGPKRN